MTIDDLALVRVCLTKGSIILAHILAQQEEMNGKLESILPPPFPSACANKPPESSLYRSHTTYGNSAKQ